SLGSRRPPAARGAARPRARNAACVGVDPPGGKLAATTYVPAGGWPNGRSGEASAFPCFRARVAPSPPTTYARLQNAQPRGTNKTSLDTLSPLACKRRFD